MTAAETRGDKLHADDRAHVLAAYLYRMTIESRRRWPGIARMMLDSGYKMPAQTDAEWLAATAFRTGKNGRLDMRVKYCRSYQPQEPTT